MKYQEISFYGLFILYEKPKRAVKQTLKFNILSENNSPDYLLVSIEVN